VRGTGQGSGDQVPPFSSEGGWGSPARLDPLVWGREERGRRWTGKAGVVWGGEDLTRETCGPYVRWGMDLPVLPPPVPRIGHESTGRPPSDQSCLDRHVNLETLRLRPNNRRRCSHWFQPRPLDAPGTVGDGNPECGALFPIKPMVVAYVATKFARAAKESWQCGHRGRSRSAVLCFATVPVDEFRTTVVHGGCGLAMKQV